MLSFFQFSNIKLKGKKLLTRFTTYIPIHDIIKINGKVLIPKEKEM